MFFGSEVTMLKVFKVLLIVIGILVLVATFGLMVWIISQFSDFAAGLKQTYPSAWWLVLAVILAALGGLLAGVGLGMATEKPITPKPERPAPLAPPIPPAPAPVVVPAPPVVKAPKAPPVAPVVKETKEAPEDPPTKADKPRFSMPSLRKPASPTSEVEAPVKAEPPTPPVKEEPAVVALDDDLPGDGDGESTK
ncbi:MAG: hypothetical protein LBE83_01970 [Propionibacteriaceae bacterium]|nr:hypothetical protein [Propionibacteriaceae bacterium]